MVTRLQKYFTENQYVTVYLMLPENFEKLVLELQSETEKEIGFADRNKKSIYLHGIKIVSLDSEEL